MSSEHVVQCCKASHRSGLSKVAPTKVLEYVNHQLQEASCLALSLYNRQ